MKQPIYLMLLLVIASLVFTSCEQNESVVNDDTNQLSIDGRLIDKLGNPVINAEIKVVTASQSTKTGNNSQSNIVAIDTTDNEGNFALNAIGNAQDFMVEISHGAYGNFSYKFDTFKSKGNSTQEKDFDLDDESDCDGVLKLKVTNTNDEDLSDVYVFIGKGDKKYIKAKLQNGYLEITGICDGEYWIKLEKDGYKNANSDFVIANGGAEKDIKMEAKENDEDCCTGKLKVNVKSKDSDTNIESGVAVLKNKKTGKTFDLKVENGWVEFSELCKGAYTLVVETNEYKRYEAVVEITCDEELALVVSLQTIEQNTDCCNAKVKIWLKSKDSGEYLNGSNIVLKNKNTGKSITSKVENGYVYFEELCEGNYTALVETELFKRFEESFEVKCDKQNEFTFQLSKKEDNNDCCDAKVSIKLTDNENSVVSKGTVVLKNNKTGKSNSVSVKNGTATFDNMCEGTYTLVIESDDHKRFQETLNIACNDENNFTISLEKKEQNSDCCDAKVKIWLKSKDSGDYLDNRTIVLKNKKTGKSISGKVANGYVYFEELCEGAYTAVVETDLFNKFEETLEVKCDKQNEYTFLLTKKEENNDCCDARVKIYTKSKVDGSYVNNAVIVLKNNKTGKAIDVRLTNGWYVLEDLCEGTYTLVVEADSFKRYQETLELKCGKNNEFVAQLIKE